MTCTSPFQTQLAHLTVLAKIPGFKAYAWHRAQELGADPSGLWTGLADALTQAMTGESAPPNLAKPRSVTTR